jgi:hypothetical protein
MHEYFIVSALQGDYGMMQCSFDPTFWGILTMSLHFWDCFPFNCCWFAIASTRAITQWTAWLIRFPLDASDDYLKTLVATRSCSFGCRMDRKLESNYIEVCLQQTAANFWVPNGQSWFIDSKPLLLITPLKILIMRFVTWLVASTNYKHRAYYHKLSWLHVTLVFDPCTMYAIC